MINKRRTAFRAPSALNRQNLMQADLYSVMNKGGRWDLQDIKKLEQEFKCYIRPVLPNSTQESGWAFLASSFDDNTIYHKIYHLRQTKRLYEEIRIEKQKIQA